MQESLSLMDNCWIQGQSETIALIEWFQLGDQNGSGVGISRLVRDAQSKQSKAPSCSLTPCLGWAGNEGKNW